MRRLLLFLSLLLITCSTFPQLNGKFSVSASKQVQFSKGNLVYSGSTKTFTFASSQYSKIGSGNQSISSTYTGSIDLFGWGTSGYNNCMPYETSLSVTYGGGGSSIAGTQYDWGVKNFTNYRTLTNDEWSYLLSSRTNASSLRGPAQVSGTNGWILLPDSWTTPSGITFKSVAEGASGYSSNTYTASQFTTLQNAGAVFLPAAGWRYSSGSSTVVSYTNSMGYYWSATSGKAITFGGAYCYSGESAATYSGCAVRLVYDTTGGGESDSYTITTAVSPAGAGTITGAGTYKQNAQATFKATASGDYQFYRFEFDADNTYSTNNPWTFYVRKSGKVTAVFKKKGYPVSAYSANDALGTVTPLGYSEPIGTVVTFTAEAKPGCRFLQWDDGVTTATRSYTIKGTETDADHPIFRAEFESVETYTLTYSSAQPDLGTVSSSKTTYKAGDYVTISATPESGQRFVCWNNNPALTKNPMTFNIYGDSTYVGYFDTASIVEIEVIASDDACGTVSGGGTYYEQEKVTLTATTYRGNSFEKWTYEYSPGKWLTASTTNPYTFKASAKRTRFKAEFTVEHRMSMNVTSSDETQGTVSITPEYDVYYSNEVIEIEAHPTPCYVFDKWSDGETQNPRTVRLPQKANYYELKAKFKPREAEVEVRSMNDNGNIRILENGEDWKKSDTYYGCCIGTPITIEAQGENGYFFVRWSDGNTENPRTFLLPEKQRVLLAAYFNKETVGGYCGYSTTSTPSEQAWWTYDLYDTIHIKGNGPLFEFGQENYHSKAPWYSRMSSTSNKAYLVIEDNITTIPSYAFNDCQGLRLADLKNSAIHTIGQNAFSYTNLNEVSLPQSLQTIQSDAFAGTTLKSIILPPNLESIESAAFYFSRYLSRIFFTNPTPIPYVNYAWMGIATDTVYVPSGTSQAYLNSWNINSSTTIRHIIEWHSVNIDIVGQGTCTADTTTFILAGDKVQLNPVAAEDWELEEILLIDQQGNIQTLYEPYQFEMPESNVTARVKFQEIVPTQIQDIEQPVVPMKAAKVIIDKHIYILRNGILYDLNGVKVKTFRSPIPL